MNRRSFLRGLIAAPAIVAASSIMPVRAIERLSSIFDPTMLTGGWRSAGFEIGNWITIDYGDSRGVQTFCITGRSSASTITIEPAFDFEPYLRDTAEPQAPVSSDNENGIPTASADDLCHFGQDTETLSPNVSRRLLRAWGVNEGRAGA